MNGFLVVPFVAGFLVVGLVSGFLVVALVAGFLVVGLVSGFRVVDTDGLFCLSTLHGGADASWLQLLRAGSYRVPAGQRYL